MRKALTVVVMAMVMMLVSASYVKAGRDYSTFRSDIRDMVTGMGQDVYQDMNNSIMTYARTGNPMGALFTAKILEMYFHDGIACAKQDSTRKRRVELSQYYHNLCAEMFSMCRDKVEARRMVSALETYYSEVPKGQIYKTFN